MATIKNISTQKLVTWNEYESKTPDQALSSLHSHIEIISKDICSWYWASIENKKFASFGVRVIAFLFLVLGTALPLFSAALNSADHRLMLTQFGAVSLVVSALLMLADRIFDWSSGWMRYITTVTAMERLIREFELVWASYIVERNTQPDNPDNIDVKKFFDLARTLEIKLTELQVEETNKWITEFNSGISLLESMIKSQREGKDKNSEEAQTKSANKAKEVPVPAGDK